MGPRSSPSKWIQIAKGMPTKGTALKLNTSRRNVLFSRRICAGGEMPSFCEPWKNPHSDGSRLPCSSVMASTRLLTPIFFRILLMCSFTVGSEIESWAAILLFGRPRIIIFKTSICRGVKLNLLNCSLFVLTAHSFAQGNHVSYPARAKQGP